MLRFFTLVCVALAIPFPSKALKVDDISSCPKLTPRKPPTSVRDLRADDIKVVMAVGDSITAAFLAKGYTKGQLNLTDFYEDRGVSYAAGGDPNATTIPNIFGHYTRNLGASVGSHTIELCFGPLCPPGEWVPSMDRLNAALSGALASNLPHEVNDYLIPQVKSYPGIDFENDWKFINIQIGSNDMCTSCLAPSTISPDSYESALRETLESIRKNIPKVIVSLVGTFNVSQTYELTTGQAYCQLVPLIPHINAECPCSLLGSSERQNMDLLSAGFNQRLLNIRNDYHAANYTDFGVLYTPADIALSKVPLEFLSNIDCFHPSLLAHAYVAKYLWNSFYSPLSTKGGPLYYHPSLQFYCPTDEDRFILD